MTTPQSFVNRFGITALLQVFGLAKIPRSNIDFEGAVSYADDPANDRAVITIPGAASTVHSGSGGNPGMNDANFAVAETSGDIYVGSGAQFTLDRTLTLPAAPSSGMKVTWGDECTTSGGSLLAHNIIVNGNGKNIQSGGTDLTGGITNAATYTGTKNAWPPGSTIELLYNGTFWKVL